jgi:hypothetical protein
VQEEEHKEGGEGRHVLVLGCHTHTYTHTNLLRQPPLCFDVSVAGIRLAFFIL